MAYSLKFMRKWARTISRHYNGYEAYFEAPERITIPLPRQSMDLYIYTSGKIDYSYYRWHTSPLSNVEWVALNKEIFALVANAKSKEDDS